MSKITIREISKKDIGRKEEEIKKIANLYCEVWREPPWNENFWTTEGVIKDIRHQLLEPNSIFLYAENCYIHSSEIVGFTWGYEIDIKRLKEISGGAEWDFLFRGNKDGFSKRMFYVDELGVDKKWRKKGIGRKLTEELIRLVSCFGIDFITLRTDQKATAARSLYEKIGFKETNVIDAKYPARTYWIR